MIVDDDANSRDVLRDVLGGEPYTLLEAADGQQALELANKEQPDLILLDIMMPGIDGGLVLHKLKEQEKTRAIPVIMVTALNSDTQVFVCLNDGAVDHICKPFSSMVVRARVRAALRSRAVAAGEKPPAARQGKVLGFIGVKGGVGTTTVAVNVALALLKTKKTVAVAEIRPYAGTVAAQLGASSSLNIEPLLVGYERTGEINPQTLSRFLTNHPTGLRLLLAPPDMDEQREITGQQAEEIVKGLAGMVDYVVVDIPSNPAKVAKAALRCCQFIAMVVELESSCLAAAPAMLKALDSWGVGGPVNGGHPGPTHLGHLNDDGRLRTEPLGVSDCRGDSARAGFMCAGAAVGLSAGALSPRLPLRRRVGRTCRASRRGTRIGLDILRWQFTISGGNVT